ncbi:MAG: peptidase C14 [Okeania sp. SIO1H6]|nr:peptidase C14 [Okeania sp. SIO1H6]
MTNNTDFNKSLAIIIGINEYQKEHGISPLKNARQDAQKLAEILQSKHHYRLIHPTQDNQPILDRDVTLENFKILFEKTLPEQLNPNQKNRLLFYFSGHGIARPGDHGPEGFLIPQPAQDNQSDTWLPMTVLYDYLAELTLSHVLVILDCCFAGAFRWSSTRDLNALPETITKAHYDRFIRSPAWQAISSAAYNQYALDFRDNRETGKTSEHSPFAEALFAGLEGKADIVPEGGDGVIVAQELALYLREQVEIGTQNFQTPQLWPLPRHERGEYIFLVPEQPLNLAETPELTEENNPYRGLKPYDEKHARFFFGRQKVTEKLVLHVSQANRQLTTVIGISGSGKSSLVKAGLIPHLRGKQEWHILEVIRPGQFAFNALFNTFSSLKTTSSNAKLDEILSDAQLDKILSDWSQTHPNHKLLLVIDQFEELVTMSRLVKARTSIPKETVRQKLQEWFSKVVLRQSKTETEQQREETEEVKPEWQKFLELLARILKNCPQLHLVITLRSDFESRFKDSALKKQWEEAKFPVNFMGIDEFQEVIEGPAQEMALYFEPVSLVDDIVEEVFQMPGALPLLSFTLSELYINLHQRWQNAEAEDRALTLEDYQKLGGVTGSLTRRADEEYDNLPDDAHRVTMQRVMLRMVELEGGETAKRRVGESEFNYPDDQETQRAETVLNQLVNARLIVKGKNIESSEIYYEPAHDFLITGWSKIQDWIREEQENLTLQRLLTPAVQEWDNMKPSPHQAALLKLWNRGLDLTYFAWTRTTGTIKTLFTKLLQQDQDSKEPKKSRFLWDNNPRLPLLEVIVNSDENWLSKTETEFIKNSVTKSQRTTAFISNTVTVVSLILIGLTIFAELQRRDVVTQRQETLNRQAGQVEALGSYSETLFLNNQKFEALLVNLQAGVGLKNIKEQEGPKVTNEMAILVMLHNLTDGYVKSNRLEDHREIVNSISFSPDSKMMASADWDGTIKLWSRDGQLRKTLKGHNDIGSVTFSPDGKTIASAGWDGTIKLWSREGDLLRSIKAHDGRIDCVAFSPDSQTIASAGEDNTARLWSLDGSLKNTLTGHNDTVTSVSFSPNGQLIATASDDNTIKLWSSDGHLKNTLTGHEESIKTVSFSPDSDKIISGSLDKTAKLWKIDGTLLQTFKGHTDQIWGVSFSPDGMTIATASVDNTIKLWNLDGSLQETLTGDAEANEQNAGFLDVQFSPDGQTIAAASEYNIIQLWQYSRNPIITLKGHNSLVANVSFSPNGNLIATASWDNTVKVWKRDGSLQATLNGHTDSVEAVSFSPDGKKISTGSQDNEVKLWNVSGELLRTFQGHTAEVLDVSFSSDGEIIASASQDNTVKLWRLDGTLENTLTGHDSAVNSVSFSPTGIIASASWDNTVRLWQRDGTLISTISDHSRSVLDLVFSPDGRTLASASEDNYIQLRKIENNYQTFIQPIYGDCPSEDDRSSGVLGISFSPDSQLIAATCGDNTVKFWKLDGTLLTTFKAHDEADFWGVSFSPDWQTLAIGSGDNTVVLWNFALDDLLARTCDIVGGYLKTNPNVSENDRNLCVRIPQPKSQQL